MRFRHIFTYILMAAFLAPAYGQNTAGSSIASKTLLSSDGARKVEQRVYDNGLGDIVQMITRTVPMIPDTIVSLFRANSKAITTFLSGKQFTRLKGGVRQAFVEKTNIDGLFNRLASDCNAKIFHNGTERYFKAGKYRVGIHESSRGGGQTIHINYNNGEKLYKIRTK